METLHQLPDKDVLMISTSTFIYNGKTRSLCVLVRKLVR